ncbi:MAG: hypothetical protein KGH81_02570, partial [Thaumarchaeota archaeon]|nr:hypothetical protein [Nitrososphaerota archaeon]
TLTVNSGTISNSGTITNNGSITNSGSIVNNGSLVNNGTITNNGSIHNSGTISGTGTITGTAVINVILTLSLTSGAVGTSVTMSGSGFVASHAITATYGGTSLTLGGTCNTNASGNLAGCTFTVPASTSGAHTVTANDLTNSPSATFTVTVTKVSTQKTTSTTISSGAASADHTGTTGIKVTIRGSSATSGTSVNLITSEISSPFTGVSVGTLSNPKYFDVLVQKISDGTTNVCITNPIVTSSSTMQYWTGSSWTSATSISVSGTTICGDIPVSALTGTNIIIGSPSSTGGRGGSTPGSPPSFITGFAQNEYPLTINSNLYKLPNYTNTGPLGMIPVGSPFAIKVTLYGDNGPQSVKHVSLVTNIHGNYASITGADTAILWDASQPLQIVDPHHFFGTITANTTVVDGKLQVTLHGTFANPMPLSDIGIRTWGYDLYSQDVYVINAWQATSVKTESNIGTLQSSQILNTTNDIILKTNTENTTTNTSTNTASNAVNDFITTVKEWAGYSPNVISNSQLLQSMGYQGNYIPPWVMKGTAKYLVDGSITQDDFAGAIKYLVDNHIVK